MQTPSYSLPGLKTKKLDIQPARGQPHRPLVLLAGSHTAALQAKPAPPSPSTPPMDITTLGGSGKKPPQLLPRGDDPPDQQPSPPKGKARKEKDAMGCLFPHAAQAMRTWGRYLQHQQQVPSHLPDQVKSSTEGDATSVPQNYTAGHTRGLSQLHFCSHNLPARRAVPSPGNHQSLPCWFGPQRPQNLGPQPQGHPRTSSKQHQESPGAQKQAPPVPSHAHTWLK